MAHPLAIPFYNQGGPPPALRVDRATSADGAQAPLDARKLAKAAGEIALGSSVGRASPGAAHQPRAGLTRSLGRTRLVPQSSVPDARRAPRPMTPAACVGAALGVARAHRDPRRRASWVSIPTGRGTSLVMIGACPKSS